jgi:hypothetical protein
MPESFSVSATEELSRNSDGSINAPVPVKDLDGTIICTVVIPLYPDGTTNRKGVSLYFGVSMRTVDEWIAGKRIPFQRRSPRMLRFRLEKVARALDKLNIQEGCR